MLLLLYEKMHHFLHLLLPFLASMVSIFKFDYKLYLIILFISAVWQYSHRCCIFNYFIIFFIFIFRRMNLCFFVCLHRPRDVGLTAVEFSFVLIFKLSPPAISGYYYFPLLLFQTALYCFFSLLLSDNFPWIIFRALFIFDTPFSLVAPLKIITFESRKFDISIYFRIRFFFFWIFWFKAPYWFNVFPMCTSFYVTQSIWCSFGFNVPSIHLVRWFNSESIQLFESFCFYSRECTFFDVHYMFFLLAQTNFYCSLLILIHVFKSLN